MRITGLDIFQCDTPFTFGFHSSQTNRLKADSIVIRLEFDNNISGYGESAPRPYVTGENTSVVIHIIKNIFSEILFLYEIHSVKDIELVLCALENECHKKNISGYNSALGAIDIALLDALGKSQHLSLCNFLGPIIRDTIPYSLSIPILPLQKIEELYHKMAGVPFTAIKVLMGTSESENIQRVGLIRSLLGDHVEIRIEVNGVWTIEQAISTIEKLKKYGICAVEQPVTKHDIIGLQKVRRSCGIPVIADESMCNLSDAINLIEIGACDILNIKISKCGGLLRSRNIADFAQSKNFCCQLGSHVGETPILDRAGECFAQTTPNLVYFEGRSFLLFENTENVKSAKKSTGEECFADMGLGIDISNHTLTKVCSLYPNVRPSQ
jgi:L-alanine-DL-glutamate epimerase-like enolase superfamily enzyme